MLPRRQGGVEQLSLAPEQGTEGAVGRGLDLFGIADSHQ